MPPFKLRLNPLNTGGSCLGGACIGLSEGLASNRRSLPFIALLREKRSPLTLLIAQISRRNAQNRKSYINQLVSVDRIVLIGILCRLKRFPPEISVHNL